jgi:peptidyl-prolyl cis-trans isomerase C
VTPQPVAVAEDPLAPEVVERDAMARLADMGPQGMAIRNNANQRAAFIEDLKRTRSLAREALKEGVDRDPVFAQRLEAQREHILATMFVDKYMQSKINDAALRRYFQRNRSAFNNHQRRAFHIVTREEPAARAAIDALREPGADLEELAQEFSPSAPEGAKSGDLGMFKRGQMLKPSKRPPFRRPLARFIRSL